MLGQGRLRAFLFDRGGERNLGEFTDCEVIRFTRVRDDISEGTLRILRDKCAGAVGTMATGRHELVIFRNGKRAWEGPGDLGRAEEARGLRESRRKEGSDVESGTQERRRERAPRFAGPDESGAMRFSSLGYT